MKKLKYLIRSLYEHREQTVPCGYGELMQTVRPKINEDLIRKVKVKYPVETAMLSNAETVEWAMNRVLDDCKAPNI